jgi:hypothetical protein
MVEESMRSGCVVLLLFITLTTPSLPRFVSMSCLSLTLADFLPVQFGRLDRRLPLVTVRPWSRQSKRWLPRESAPAVAILEGKVRGGMSPPPTQDNHTHSSPFLSNNLPPTTTRCPPRDILSPERDESVASANL